MTGFNPNKMNPSSLESGAIKIEKKGILANFEEVDISKEIPTWLQNVIVLIKQKVNSGEDYVFHKIVEELTQNKSDQEKIDFYKEIEESGGLHDVLNKISRGTYFDPSYLNHVVYAKNTYRRGGEEEHRATIIGNNKFSPEGFIQGYKLEFANGMNTHFGSDPTKKMIIVNPRSESFRKIMSSEDNSYGYSFDRILTERFKDTDTLDKYIESLKVRGENGKDLYEVDRKDIAVLWELLKRKLPVLEKDSSHRGGDTYHGYGFSLPIMEGDLHSCWADIADTIIDLEAGKAWYRKNQ